MFPSEARADAWNNQLSQLVAFIGMSAAVFAALARDFGEFNDRITNLATIPEAVYREGVKNAAVITRP